MCGGGNQRHRFVLKELFHVAIKPLRSYRNKILLLVVALTAALNSLTGGRGRDTDTCCKKLGKLLADVSVLNAGRDKRW